MGEQIVVTPAQLIAAKMQVELADQLGEAVSPLIRRIANAADESRSLQRPVVEQQLQHKRFGRTASRKSKRRRRDAALSADTHQQHDLYLERVRWAIELATSDDQTRSAVGLQVLSQLFDSDHLDPETVDLVRGVLIAMTQAALSEYDATDLTVVVEEDSEVESQTPKQSLQPAANVKAQEIQTLFSEIEQMLVEAAANRR